MVDDPEAVKKAAAAKKAQEEDVNLKKKMVAEEVENQMQRNNKPSEQSNEKDLAPKEKFERNSNKAKENIGKGDDLMAEIENGFEMLWNDLRAFLAGTGKERKEVKKLKSENNALKEKIKELAQKVENLDGGKDKETLEGKVDDLKKQSNNVDKMISKEENKLENKQEQGKGITAEQAAKQEKNNSPTMAPLSSSSFDTPTPKVNMGSAVDQDEQPESLDPAKKEEEKPGPTT